MVVLFAGLLHAIWNAVAKGLSDLRTNFALLNVGVWLFSLVCLPFVGGLRSGAWPYLVASIVVHQVYELVLMRAYGTGDFSRSYPIARGIAPLLVTAAGFALAHEHLGWLAMFGVLAIVSGVVALAGAGSSASPGDRAVHWALVTGVAIALYSVVDGYGVRASHDSLAYASWLFLLQSTCWLGVVTFRHGRSWWPTRRIALQGVAGGVVSMIAYSIVLWAQTRATLGTVSALRETGVLWAAVIGAVAFREGRLVRLVLPAMLVVLGVTLLTLPN